MFVPSVRGAGLDHEARSRLAVRALRPPMGGETSTGRSLREGQARKASATAHVPALQVGVVGHVALSVVVGNPGDSPGGYLWSRLPRRAVDFACGDLWIDAFTVERGAREGEGGRS
jgi:hypothetical protein